MRSNAEVRSILERVAAAEGVSADVLQAAREAARAIRRPFDHAPAWASEPGTAAHDLERMSFAIEALPLTDTEIWHLALNDLYAEMLRDIEPAVAGMEI